MYLRSILILSVQLINIIFPNVSKLMSLGICDEISFRQFAGEVWTGRKPTAAANPTRPDRAAMLAACVLVSEIRLCLRLTACT
jgi:hypothetical protein